MMEWRWKDKLLLHPTLLITSSSSIIIIIVIGQVMFVMIITIKTFEEEEEEEEEEEAWNLEKVSKQNDRRRRIKDTEIEVKELMLKYWYSLDDWIGRPLLANWLVVFGFIPIQNINRHNLLFGWTGSIFGIATVWMAAAANGQESHWLHTHSYSPCFHGVQLCNGLPARIALSRVCKKKKKNGLRDTFLLKASFSFEIQYQFDSLLSK